MAIGIRGAGSEVDPAAARSRRSLWSQPTHLRLFQSDRGAPRARRATDVILLLGSLVGAAVVASGAEPPSGFEASLIQLAKSVPTFLDVAWRVLVGALSVWGAALVVASAVRWRPAVLRDILLAGGLGYVLAIVLGDRIAAADDPVSVHLAVVTAATVAASPHLAQPFRTTGRWILTGGATALVMLETTTPSGAVLGLLCGSAAAAVIHLVLGSSAGRPPMDEVAKALGALGVQATDLSEAQRQFAGVFLVDARDPDGGQLQIKLYGRDAWDAQVLAKSWRGLWYRDAAALTLTRLQQAEHEAFATLLAERHGVPVNDVVNAGRTVKNDAMIVLRRVGIPLPRFAATAERRQLLGGMWDTVLALQAAGMAHGDLAPDRFTVHEGTVVLNGFEAASVSASGDQRRIERAQLLVTTCLVAGIDDAMSVAAERLGTEGMTDVLPYLQTAALGRNLRSAVDQADLDLDDVRAAASTAAGTEPPKLASLHRVSKGTLFQVLLMTAAAYFLITSLSGVPLADVADDLRGAKWSLLVVALFLAQTPRLAQAIATRGACPRPIAYGPVAVLQYAITFVNLVIPSTAARIAVNIRFFQRQGIPPASAVSIGAIDGFGGFVVQLLILASAFLFGSQDLDLELPSDGGIGGGGLLRLIVALGVVLALVVVVVLVIPSLRARLLERVRPWIHEAVETLGNLRSPAKLAQVLGGNLLSELLFASTMGLVLAAFHTSLPLGTLLVINVSVSFFAGLMPVPGGIGVSEGAMILGLTAAGIDDATALAATISYRMMTFYLPPIWGFLAFRHLEHEGML